MTTARAVTLLVIFGGLAAASLAEAFKAKAAQVNPLFLPLLNTSLASDSQESQWETVESMINHVLMNGDPKRTNLWVELVRGVTKYEFYFDRSWDPQNNEESALRRLAKKTFRQYLELGNDEQKCRRVPSADMKLFEERFRAKILNFLGGLVEHREKGLLYQVLPNGSFDRVNKVTLVFKNDVSEVTALLFPEVEPFVRCLEIHRSLAVEDGAHDGIFARFWNWLRRLFGLQPKRVIEEEADDKTTSQVRRDVGGASAEAEFPDKPAEYRAFIEEAGKQGTQSLQAYKDNLELLMELMRSPEVQIANVVEALLLQAKASANFDSEAWRTAAFPVLEYSMSLNCENAGGKCQPVIIGAFPDAYDGMTKAFVKAFNDRAEIEFGRVRELEKFVFEAYQTFLLHLATIDQGLAVRSLRIFWGAFTKNTRSADQRDNLVVAKALEALMPDSPQAMSNGRVYSLAHEIITYLPEGQQLSGADWFPLFIGFFADFSNSFGLDVLRIGGASKIMHLEPLGPDEALASYYDALNGLVIEYFQTSAEAVENWADFPARFDAFLDSRFKSEDPRVAQNYPALKLHNLWGATEQTLLPFVHINGYKKTDLKGWFLKFVEPALQKGFAGFLEKRLAGKEDLGASSKWGPETNIWESLGKVSWTEAQELSPKIAGLLNKGPRQVEDAQKYVQLI